MSVEDREKSGFEKDLEAGIKREIDDLRWVEAFLKDQAGIDRVVTLGFGAEGIFFKDVDDPTGNFLFKVDKLGSYVKDDMKQYHLDDEVFELLVEERKHRFEKMNNPFFDAEYTPKMVALVNPVADIWEVNEFINNTMPEICNGATLIMDDLVSEMDKLYDEPNEKTY